MTRVETGGSASDLPLLFRPLAAIADRLEGPGGYYNAGNLLGLVTALATQFFAGATSDATTFGDRIYGYFAGSPSAVALTVATTIFLFSGETYHRAWAGRAVPSKRLNRIADLLSVAGATALTISLIYAGQTALALVSGLLVVGGKLGSAITGDDRSSVPLWPHSWSDPFRVAVLAGRAPGLLAAALDLGRHMFDQPGGMGLFSLVPPAVLVICYGLWIRADVLLVGSAGRTAIAPAMKGTA